MPNPEPYRDPRCQVVDPRLLAGIQAVHVCTDQYGEPLTDERDRCYAQQQDDRRRVEAARAAMVDALATTVRNSADEMHRADLIVNLAGAGARCASGRAVTRIELDIWLQALDNLHRWVTDHRADQWTAVA